MQIMNKIMNWQTQHSHIAIKDTMVSNIKKEISEDEGLESEREPIDGNLVQYDNCNHYPFTQGKSQMLQVKIELGPEQIVTNEKLPESIDNENHHKIAAEIVQLDVQEIKREDNPDIESLCSLGRAKDSDLWDAEHTDIKREGCGSEYTNVVVINKKVVEKLEYVSKHKIKTLKKNESEIIDNHFTDGGAEINNYKCPICSSEYPCLETFKHHIEFHSNSDLTRNSSHDNIVNNINTITVDNNKSRKVHSCDMCSYTSTHLNNLRTHKRTHSGERPFACKDCDYTSSQLVHLKSHQLIHLGLKPFACDECDHTCRDSSHLKAHKLLHTGVKPFACVDCDFTCRVASQLRVHKRIHTGEKPFPCDECDFVGDYAHSLKEHKQIHTGEKPFACDKCGYSTRWLRHLKTHQRVHTGEKPYKCDECGYTSSQKSHLITHKRTHSGEKPYACDKCSYTSSQLTHIREHKRRHSDEKPYGCEKCSYTTRTSQELRRHKMSRGHGGLPPQPRGKVKKEPA